MGVRWRVALNAARSFGVWRGIHGGLDAPPQKMRVPSSRASAAVGNFTANQQKKALEGLHAAKGFDLEGLGVGGLDAEFGTLFRRVFASRLAPPGVVRDLGVRHVRGVILEGPPGTGKTLLARQMASLLKARPPKVVAGPEIFSMHVGESEEAVRALFYDAENEWKLRGEESSLHVVVLDEMDAIGRRRGTGGGGAAARVQDNVVNQLLAKMDGVDALNNVLLIGTTNRSDLLDPALLRPGRFEVTLPIRLPGAAGRAQILRIHTKGLAEKGLLAPDVDVDGIAKSARNYTGAELSGVVASASSYALDRSMRGRLASSGDQNSKPEEAAAAASVEGMGVLTGADFEQAMAEVRPALGSATERLQALSPHGLYGRGTGSGADVALNRLARMVQLVRQSEKTPLLTCLLTGPEGVGKRAIAATAALDAAFPLASVVSADELIQHGGSPEDMASLLHERFSEAHRSSLSILLLDSVERLVQFSSSGTESTATVHSNPLLQALLVNLKRRPPAGHRLLVLATSSDDACIQTLCLRRHFNTVLPIRCLDAKDARAVLAELDCFESPAAMDTAISMLPCLVRGGGLPVRKLILALKATAQATAARSAAGGPGHAGRPLEASWPARLYGSTALGLDHAGALNLDDFAEAVDLFGLNLHMPAFGYHH